MFWDGDDRPDEQMLRALYTVLEKENSEPIFILGPTAVVHTFCRNHECTRNEAVEDYVNFLETKILEQLQQDVSARAVREKVRLCSFIF